MYSAKNAIAQILINSKMCALGKRPICQDTGIVNVFIEVGMDDSVGNSSFSWKIWSMKVFEELTMTQITDLRASIVSDPLVY